MFGFWMAPISHDQLEFCLFNVLPNNENMHGTEKILSLINSGVYLLDVFESCLFVDRVCY